MTIYLDTLESMNRKGNKYPVNTFLKNTKGRSGRRGRVKRESSCPPPTRRNANETTPVNKSRNESAGKPMSARVKSASSCRYQSVPDGDAFSNTLLFKQASMEQHDYLQFSLRITEEIIRNDFYKNEEMVKVLKNHYLANRCRLDEEKLQNTLLELCAELNIPFDDNLWIYLNDKGPYTPGKSKEMKPQIKKYPDVNMNGVNVAGPVVEPINAIEIRPAVTNNDKDSLKHVLELMTNCMSSCPLDMFKINYESDDSKPERESDVTIEKSEDELVKPIINNNFKNEENLNISLTSPINVTATDTEYLHQQCIGRNNQPILLTTSRSDVTSSQPLQSTSTIALENNMDLSQTVLQTERDYKEIEGSYHEETVGNSAIQNNVPDTEGNSIRDPEPEITVVHKSSDTSGSDTFVNSVRFGKNEIKNSERKMTTSYYYTSIDPRPKNMVDLSVQTNQDDLCCFKEVGHQTPEIIESRAADSNPADLTTTIYERQPPRTGTTDATDDGFCVINKSKNNNNCYDDLQMLVHQQRPQQAYVYEPITNFVTAQATGQFIVFDGPVLIPKEKSREVISARSMRFPLLCQEESSYHVAQKCCVDSKNSAVLHPLKLKSFDREPSCPSYPSNCINTMPSSHKEQLLFDLNNKYNVGSRCSCKVNDTNGLLLTNRYERYKKVNDTLSYFYPTIATQVSSMDLLHSLDGTSNGITRVGSSTQTRDRLKVTSDVQRGVPCRDRPKFDEEPDTPLSPKIGRSRSPVKQKSGTICDYDYQNFNYEARYSSNGEENYASSSNNKITNIVSEENVVAKETVKNCVQNIHPEITPLVDSSESMEKRITNLKQDIQKYREESLSDEPVKSIGSPNNLVPLEETVSKGTRTTTLLPSAMALPRHKKMAILRKNL